MKPERLVVVLIAVAAVITMIVVGRDRESEDGAAPEGSIEVSFAYSPEKEELLEPLIEDFNASGATVGKAQVFVRGKVVSSGEAEQRIADGKLRPVAWSPASSLWGRLLNYEADRELTAEGARSIVRTPLRDRDVGADGASARLAGAARSASATSSPRALGDGLGGLRPRRSSATFKLVHTNPGLLNVGALGGGRRVLRRDG